MDALEFRRRGREMVDYVADYLETIEKRRVLPDVRPGYLGELLPDTAPEKPETFDSIMADVEKAIMPGITHWQHPRFHAYFPAGNSYPSLLADMLSDALGVNGFSWAASPACTELEVLVVNWLAKMIGLPRMFWHGEADSNGGGVIQGSASECVLVSMLAARHAALCRLKLQHPYLTEGTILSRMVAYCSKLAHSCVEKAAMISLVKVRELDTDDKYSLRGHILEKAIKEDQQRGLFPFYVCATLGTTAVCSFDNVEELGEVCRRIVGDDVWFHVESAYAGSALICPEFRHLIDGIERANSFNMNPNKWMLVHFDCSALWVRDRKILMDALTVDPLYLQHSHSDKAVDFRHWGIPLSRRFRALKLWFVIRSYGVEGLQRYIREHCRLAKVFEAKVLADDRFEVIGNVTMGLVCFRLQAGNQRTQALLRAINLSGELHMVPAVVDEDYVIRFAVCSANATEQDMMYAWMVIQDKAADVKAALRSSIRQRLSRGSARAHELQKVVPIEALVPPQNDDNEISAIDEVIDNEGIFLFDENIPSIPTILPSSEDPLDVPEDELETRRRRNQLLRLISDPKTYYSYCTGPPRRGAKSRFHSDHTTAEQEDDETNDTDE